MPVVFYNKAVEAFDFGPGHPFDLKRGRMFIENSMRHGILGDMDIECPVPAMEEDLLLFHNASFIDSLKDVNGGISDWRHLVYGLGYADNPVFKGVYDLSLVFAGTALGACSHALYSGDPTVFVPVGGFHHAMPSRAAGFCYVNDLGIAIARLVGKGLRVLYVDIDAHHGDGVQEGFYGDDRVLKISFHESGKTLFPGTGFENETGKGKGLGYTVNIPMMASSDDEIFLWLFKNIFPPLAAWFKADITIAELGVDMMSTDPLAHLRTTNNSYIEAVKIIKENSKVLVSFGGGGYNLDNIAKCYTLAWAVMNGINVESDPYTCMLGGNFLGSSELNTLSSMLDMQVMISGPEKDAARLEAARVFEYIKSNIFGKWGI